MAHTLGSLAGGSRDGGRSWQVRALRSRRQIVQGGLALAGLGLVAGCGLLPPAWQQRPKVARIGNLAPNSRNDISGPPTTSWLQGLRDHGWIEGQNLAIEYRFAEGRPDRYAQLAAELAGLQLDAIFTGAGTNAIRALQQATSTTPIVMVTSSDPVAEGLVASFARPGGNVTGVSLSPEVSRKRLQLLTETVPTASQVAMLWDASNPSQNLQTVAAAQVLGVQLLSLEVHDQSDLAGALESARHWPAEALITSSGAAFSSQLAQIVEFSAANRLPAMYYTREYVQAGGLMSYGPSTLDMFRQAAGLLARILDGAKPADLPVEQPTTFDFTINLKTAQSLGLPIPPSVLQQATEVIQ